MLGIIAAMQIELQNLRSEMTDVQVSAISGMDFIQGKLNGRDVVAAVCGVGKVAAAICAQTMILKYPVTCIINTGIAGTLCNELGIKDVAIASDVVQHDMDTSALGDPVGLISSLNLVHMPCSEAAVQALEKAVQNCGVSNYRIGTIASGDVFLHSDEQKKRIVENFGAIAGEMEGASIGQVCCTNKVPFVVLRTISDDASGNAPVSYNEFAGEAAALGCRIVNQFSALLEV